jgi:hypothetical protein
MAKSNDKTAPKVSPFSQSIWQDPQDPMRWNWSVQRGMGVHKQGHSSSYEEANIKAGQAMTGMLNQFGR